MKAADILVSYALVLLVFVIALPAGSMGHAPKSIKEQHVGKVAYLTSGVCRSEVAVVRVNAKDYLLELIPSQVAEHNGIVKTKCAEIYIKKHKKVVFWWSAPEQTHEQTHG